MTKTNDSSEHELFDGIASEWLERYIKSPSSVARIITVGNQIKESLTSIKLGSPQYIRVLDFGSGPGIFGSYASKYADEVVCLDSSDGMKLAFENNQESLGNIIERYGSSYFPDRVKFKIGNESALSEIPNKAYDLILAIGVFEYLKSPLATLSEMFRCLNVGGSVILTIPNEKSVFRKIEPSLNAITVTLGERFGIKRLSNRKYTGYDKSYSFPNLYKEVPELGRKLSKVVSVPISIGPIGRSIKPNLLYVLS